MIQEEVLKTVSEGTSVDVSKYDASKDPLAGIDIESEYALIQEKKSDLSRAKRELILKIYPDYIKWKNAKNK